MQKKRKRQNKKRNRFIQFFKLLILFLLITFSLAYLSLYGLSNWKVFNIKKIEISKTKNIDKLLIKRKLQNKFNNKNMFLVRNESIQNNLNNFPKIKNTKIIRRIPNTLILSIDERLPIAKIIGSKKIIFTIDKEGYLLEKISINKKNNLPIFDGIQINNLTIGDKISENSLKILLNIYKIIMRKKPEFLKKISNYSFIDGNVLLFERNTGIKFLLGREKFLEKIEKLFFVYNNYPIAEYSEIDLRFSDSKNEIIILR
ncbi:MAG: FtsQ-type POTRA domain-containing protein [Candidatus Cloacimonetes bacterium]|nr:FtsQ-type POTRA domain-containing protein [Candidatus Cloacimonadota bacterium]